MNKAARLRERKKKKKKTRGRVGKRITGAILVELLQRLN